MILLPQSDLESKSKSMVMSKRQGILLNSTAVLPRTGEFPLVEVRFSVANVR